MLRSPKLLLLLLGSLLLVTVARGAVGTDLYSASTPVSDQSSATRTAAFARDLAQVFVKVSGDPQAPEAATLASALAHAEALVLEYRYEPRGGHGKGLQLWARFDPKGVNKALAGAGEPLWGRERPSVLALVLTPSGIVSDGSSDPVATALSKAATARGLPLLLPLMDLQDQSRILPFDIRTQFLPDLRLAAKRYGTQALLVGTIRPSATGASGAWTLAVGKTATPFQVSAPSPATAAVNAVDEAATLLAEEFAQVATGLPSGTVEIVIDQVTSLQAEVAVERTIAGVQGIAGSRLVSVRGHSIRFEARYSGTPRQLERALALTGVFAASTAPAPAAATQGVGYAILRFSYSP